MGIVFSGMFGFGLVLFTKVETDQHLDHILFGNMLGVTARDLVETADRRRRHAADRPDQAPRPAALLLRSRTMRAPSACRCALLHYGLLVLLSLTIVAALKAVGIILVIAMLIAPGAIAYLITRTMGSMLIVAVLVATVASFSGVYLSFFIDSAPAPTIVLLMTVIFLAAFLWSSWRTARIEAQRTTVE